MRMTDINYKFIGIVLNKYTNSHTDLIKIKKEIYSYYNKWFTANKENSLFQEFFSGKLQSYFIGFYYGTIDRMTDINYKFSLFI